MDFVRKHFAGATLEECHNGYIRYQIPSDAGMSLADCFDLMEAAKVQTGIEDYSVTQTTLEEIFCSFAEGGRAEEDAGDTGAPVRNGTASSAGHTTMAMANPVYLQAASDDDAADGGASSAEPEARSFDEDGYLTIVSPGVSHV